MKNVTYSVNGQEETFTEAKEAVLIFKKMCKKDDNSYYIFRYDHFLKRTTIIARRLKHIGKIEYYDEV